MNLETAWDIVYQTLRVAQWQSAFLASPRKPLFYVHHTRKILPIFAFCSSENKLTHIREK